jgi:hypothetical protein
MSDKRSVVVIVGGGFGGLAAARAGTNAATLHLLPTSSSRPILGQVGTEPHERGPAIHV